MQLNRTPNALTRTDRENLDKNWGLLEEAINKLGPAPALAELAKRAAEQANAKTDNVQKQLNTFVVNGDSSPQATQASVGADGTDYDGNLKARLDAEHNTVTAQLAETENDLEMRGINIRQPPFNANTDGSDQTSVIQRAIERAVETGYDLIIPSGTFHVVSLIALQKISIKGTGTLKLHSEALNSDYVLDIRGDYSKVEGISIDGNKTGNLNNTGRGEGLRVSGSKVEVRRVNSKNTRDNSFGNTFYNIGNYNIYENCNSENAGYAGFRNASGSYLEIKNFNAKNFRIKGFVHAGNSKKINIDGIVCETNSLELAVDAILIDPGTNFVDFLSLRNVRIEGTNQSNNIKIINTGFVTIENAELLSPNVIYSIHTYARVDSLYLSNVYSVAGSMLKDIKKLVISNSEFNGKQGIAPAYSLSIESTNVLQTSNLTVRGGTAAGVRIQYNPLVQAILRDTIFDGVDSSKNLLGIVTDSGSAGSRIALDTMVILTGSDYASVTGKNFVMKRF